MTDGGTEIKAGKKSGKYSRSEDSGRRYMDKRLQQYF